MSMSTAAKPFQDAIAALKAQKFGDAERLFKAFLKSEPQHVGALNLLTVALMSQERFADAKEYIAKAVKLNGRSDASYRNYGIILKRLGKRSNNSIARSI
jgi:protein O-GlcNAc transferase